MTSSGDGPEVSAASLAIHPRGEALLLGVRVSPSAARTEMRGIQGDRLKIAVSAPPERGKANARLVEALAGWLEIPLRSVRVESGHGGRDKVVAFSGVKEDELRARLSSLLRGPGHTKRTIHEP